MPDLKKVIKGMECIISSGNAGMRDDCANCIYPGGGDCLVPALRDALALLKAQEPRVMTLGKMREGEVYWFDCPGNFILRPVICNMYDRGDSSYLNFVWQYGNFSWKISEYGRTWRCWTFRPTEEQREVTPWTQSGGKVI